MDIDDPFMSPSTSQSAPTTSTKKLHKIDLSLAQLTAFNKKMNYISKKSLWKTIIDSAANDVSEWQFIFSTILMELVNQAATMDLKNSLIAIPSPSEAKEIVEGFDTKEFEEWKDGVLKGVKEGNWADLIQHRMYLLPWTPDRVQLHMKYLVDAEKLRPTAPQAEEARRVYDSLSIYLFIRLIFGSRPGKVFEFVGRLNHHYLRSLKYSNRAPKSIQRTLYGKCCQRFNWLPPRRRN
jgi:hypothetical protein